MFSIVTSFPCYRVLFLNAGVVARVAAVDVKAKADDWHVRIIGTEFSPKVFNSQKIYSTGVLSEIISLKKAEDTALYKYVMTVKGLKVHSCIFVQAFPYLRVLNMHVHVQRMEIKDIVQDEPFLCGRVQILQGKIPDPKTYASMVAKFREQVLINFRLAVTFITHARTDTE